jgi:hypothetical protein
MPTAQAYEKPSLISQALVVCFTIAVILMAGWFVSTIMFTKYGTTSAVDDTEIVTVAPATLENVSPDPDKSPVTARLNSAYFEPSAYATAAPPRPALPLASVTEPPPAAPRDAGYPASSVTTVVPDANYRGIQADEPLTAGALVATADPTADFVPLPPPPPPTLPRMRGRAGWGVASIPVPRPRPRLEAEEVQPGPEQAQSLFNLLMYGPR